MIILSFGFLVWIIKIYIVGNGRDGVLHTLELTSFINTVLGLL